MCVRRVCDVFNGTVRHVSVRDTQARQTSDRASVRYAS